MPQISKYIYKDFFAFLRFPEENPEKIASLKEKFVYFVNLIGLDLIFAMVTFPIIGTIYYFSDFTSFLDDVSFFEELLLACIFAPILEEVLFRLPLKIRYNPIISFINSFTNQDFFENYILRNYTYYFYFLSIIFGLIHLTNLDSYGYGVILFSLILYSNQIFGALIYGFIRLKMGFIWSIFAHSIFNFLIISIPFLIFGNISKDEYEFESDTMILETIEYRNEFQELKYIDQNDSLIFEIDFQNANLQHFLDSLYTDENPQIKLNSWVSIKLESDNGVNKREILKVIDEEFLIK